MAANVGTAYVDVRPDLSGFGRQLRSGMGVEIDRAGKESARSLQASFGDAAKGAAAAFGAAFAVSKVADFLGDSIKAASDLNESMTKVGVVFGDSSGQIRAFADTAATSLGQSRQQALEATGTFGNLFTAMGLSEGAAAGMSIELVKLASDLASFNNVSPDDALLALRSGLVGEQEPLRRFGVNLNEATLKAKALELGIRGTSETLDPAAKAQAAYALILEQTATAQGDFARTSDGLANQQRIMTAQWTDAKAELGEGLLPVMISLAGFINDTLIPTFETFFLASGANATGWAATFREAITDAVGFAAGAIAQFARLIANIVAPTPFGDDFVRDMRAGADAIDGARERLHASTGELLLWDEATEGATDAASRFSYVVRGLLPEIKDVGEGIKTSSQETKDAAKASRDAANADRDLANARRDYAALLKQGAVDEEKVADARERLNSATRSLAGANRTLAKAQREYDDALALATLIPIDANIDKLSDASDNLADAKDGVADATAREKDASEDLAKARAGDPDYQDKLADARDKVADAEDKVAKAVDKVTVAVKAAEAAQKSLNSEWQATADQARAILGYVSELDPVFPGIPAPGVPVTPSVGTTGVPGVRPGGNMIGIPNVAYTPVPTGGKVNNVTVNINEPIPDPALLGKAIAWAI